MDTQECAFKVLEVELPQLLLPYTVVSSVVIHNITELCIGNKVWIDAGWAENLLDAQSQTSIIRYTTC